MTTIFRVLTAIAIVSAPVATYAVDASSELAGVDAAAQPYTYEPGLSPPLPSCTAGCSGVGCTSPCCASDCCASDCCTGPWAHRSGMFGEFLYLRARDAEVAYAVPIDGGILPPPAVPVQVGAVAITDPDYSAGFRVGGVWALDDCSSIVGTYSNFESNTNSTATAVPPIVLRSLVLHPGTANAASDFLDAAATLDINFDLVDVDYREVWRSGNTWAVNYLVGVRYARLEQNFRAVHSGVGTVDIVNSAVHFDGGGFRLGLDFEQHVGTRGVLFYGKSTANFIAGEFRAAYHQGSNVDPTIVDTDWEAGRIMTILDLELGIGWQSRSGNFRMTAGYLFSGWFNAVGTDEWIEGVQSNDFEGLGEGISFDGLTARMEYRF